MKRITTVFIAMLLLLNMPASALARSSVTELGRPSILDSQPVPKPGFDKKISTICQSNKVVGMSMAVFSKGEVIYTKSYGYADRENRQKATDKTIYRAASIAKPVTNIGAMMLVGQGRLDLDAPISRIIGVNLDNSAATPNTTRHLMTHSSTIGDTSAYLQARDIIPYPSLEGIKKLGTIHNAPLPGQRYDYTNLGAGLVAAVIESVTRQRIYEYMDDNIFDKLKIDAAFISSRIGDTGNIAHIYRDGRLNVMPRSWNRTRAAYDAIPLGQQWRLGQADMYISAPDLAKLGIVLAGDGSYRGIRLLSPESVAEMHKRYISDDQQWYGLGIRINKSVVRGRTITGHPGQAFGSVNGLYYDRADQTGVAILTNGCSIVMQKNGLYKINNELVRAVYEEFFS